MSEFFDSKEEVMDFKLTQWGHYLLSSGKFKPAYYAFFDDDVTYDGDHIGVTENQKDIHKRITEETPYMKTQVIFDSVEDEIQKAVEIGRSMINIESLSKGGPDLEYLIETTQFARRNFAIEKQLGTSSDKTVYSPAWNIQMLSGKISGSTDCIEGKFETSDIPQIDIEIEYKKEVKNIDDVDFSIDHYFDESYYLLSGRTDEFSDRTLVEIAAEDPTIDIQEINTDFLMKNFDVAVYKVVESLDVDGTTGEYLQDQLTELKFIRDRKEVVNGYLIDRDDYDPDMVTLDPSYLEYYFNFEFDNQIPKDHLHSLIERYKSKGYYTDIMSNPVGMPASLQENYNSDVLERYRMDIYGSTAGEVDCDD